MTNRQNGKLVPNMGDVVSNKFIELSNLLHVLSNLADQSCRVF